MFTHAFITDQEHAQTECGRTRERYRHRASLENSTTIPTHCIVRQGVPKQRKGERQDSQYSAMSLDVLPLRPIPPPLNGLDERTVPTGASKKRPRTNTTVIASDLNSDANLGSSSKRRKPTDRPPETHSPTPETSPEPINQRRGRGFSGLPIASTSASSKGKRDLNSDPVPMVAMTDSPNPRARKVQRLNGHPPLPPINSTPQRKKPPRTPKINRDAGTSVYMNLGGRRLSTPLRMSPPIIDLTTSPPPASPSDDPILLVGSELDRARRRSQKKPSLRANEPRRPQPSSSKLKAVKDEGSIMQSYNDSSAAAVKFEDGASLEMDAYLSGQAPTEPAPKEEPVSPIPRSFPPPIIDSNGPPRGEGGPSADSSFAMDEDTADDSYSADDLGFIGPEFTIPIRQGSPSPPTLHRRSFTKLGQRKPTPRRLVLEGEGDVSMMAKTVYYEHDEDQVEPPSPSPMSRRRVKNVILVGHDEPTGEVAEDRADLGSPLPYPRILDGLDASREEGDAQADTSAQMGPDGRRPSEELESDVSGYVHDPTGFEILREMSPDSLQDNIDQPPAAITNEKDDLDERGHSVDPADVSGDVHDPTKFDILKETSLDPPQDSIDQPDATTTAEKDVSSISDEPLFEEDGSPTNHQVSEISEAPIVNSIRPPTPMLIAPPENIRRSESRASDRNSLSSFPEISAVRRSESRHVDDERNKNRGRGGTPSQVFLAQTSEVHPHVEQNRRDTEEDPEDEDHSSYDFDDDSPVVEVSSTNPRAAARAAVILKMVRFFSANTK